MTEMTKLEKFVQDNKILPSQCAYHTWRDVSNKKGEPIGKMRILVLKTDKLARVEYICPSCIKSGYTESPWQRPFSFNCQSCGIVIKVPKLKEQFKREMKKANKSK